MENRHLRVCHMRERELQPSLAPSTTSNNLSWNAAMRLAGANTRSTSYMSDFSQDFSE